MTCHVLRNGDGTFAGFVCVKRRRPRPRACACGRTAWKLCDGRAPSGKKLCSRPLCDGCALSVGGDLDYCPACRTQAPEPIPGALFAYTDGSGTVASLPCGAGVVVYDGAEVILEAARHLGPGTNNHAEVSAVRIALAITAPLARPLVVRSDSLYTINALVGRPPDEGATNARLILATRRLMLGRVVAFEHVRGHVGLAGNERADELATLGRLRAPHQPSLAIGAST